APAAGGKPPRRPKRPSGRRALLGQSWVAQELSVSRQGLNHRCFHSRTHCCHEHTEIVEK
ncbi:unnamed protein product, partial [Heterosigma akashiwo]